MLLSPEGSKGTTGAKVGYFVLYSRPHILPNIAYLFVAVAVSPILSEPLRLTALNRCESNEKSAHKDPICKNHDTHSSASDAGGSGSRVRQLGEHEKMAESQ